WQAERLPYNYWSGVRNSFQRLMITGFADRVRDARIERRIACEISSDLVIACLCGADFCATNTGSCIQSERIAIADSACVFAANTLGTETIADGSSGKRLRLPTGCASGQQHRATFKWIGTGGKSSRLRRRRIESTRLRRSARESDGAALGAR